eukprot:357123-Chlamydomonas_euryale.AAC.5
MLTALTPPLTPPTHTLYPSPCRAAPSRASASSRAASCPSSRRRRQTARRCWRTRSGRPATWGCCAHTTTWWCCYVCMATSA